MAKEILRIYPIAPSEDPVPLDSALEPVEARLADEGTRSMVTSDIVHFDRPLFSADRLARLEVKVPEKWRPVYMQIVTVLGRGIPEYILRLQGSDCSGSYYDVDPFMPPNHVKVVYV